MIRCDLLGRNHLSAHDGTLDMAGTDHRHAAGRIPGRLRRKRRDMPAHVPAKRAIRLAAAILFCCGQATASEDIQVHCRGQGPSLYPIGGGPAFTNWNLQPIQDRLSDGYRVCRWDMRGVGDNSSNPCSPKKKL
jgi:hypothetical protein